MAKLLILADDLTGAMDTAVHFAKAGIRTKVGTDTASLIAKNRNADVLAVNTETRHLTPEEAYQKVYREARIARQAGIPYLYKKTDSALRGNVGAELTAALEAWEAPCLPFVPAYPSMNRITKDGVQWIDGVAVAQSDLGQDAYAPVSCSNVADLLRMQTELPVINHLDMKPDVPFLEIYDAQTDQDLLRIAHRLREQNTRVMAGCAGLAAVMPAVLGMPAGTPPDANAPEKLLVLCASMHPATRAQLKYAAKEGFCHVRLPLAVKLGMPESAAERHDLVLNILARCRQELPVMVDSNDANGETLRYANANAITHAQVRNAVARAMGTIGMELVTAGVNSTLLITGGDTLMAFLAAAGTSELSPVAEIFPGVVLSWLETGMKRVHVISKAGSFGDSRLLISVAQFLKGEKTRLAQSGGAG